MLLLSALIRRRVLHCHRRSFASATLPSAEHSIYLSRSTNPYFNLTFEDWLFRHKTPSEPLLFLYRDDPCVVIGRNQNPWKEVNLPALRAREGVPFIRRRSGGGTVYHDLGNTNFSIHLPRQSFDRHATAQIVLRAVRALGIDANVNDRNDICVGKEKIAYKIVNRRAYHHGTMLISTELKTLGDLLRTNKDTMETKGVASVRSPVCNLRQFSTNITHDHFVNAVIDEFLDEYPTALPRHINLVDEADWKDVEYIKHGMAELPSWDWAYGQTPEFIYKVKNTFSWGTAHVTIRSKHGVILECKIHVSDSVNGSDSSQSFEEIERFVQDKKYGFMQNEKIPVLGVDDPSTEFISWLLKVMDS
ncbi:Lipoyltransferase and lipoate-protein ligase [Dendrothele bispora CBS 962.96]|uniref:Putative lipoate-protein ligase A n=1 Tax=Dendrothele bispora (strain CBS 962.96) TaxID=1314807 RepID=A0A4S8LR67_DENBC|nr:Lipoyltransferase and lipoate-protein ligase [Dendrothele bispora CBS 962.96]